MATGIKIMLRESKMYIGQKCALFVEKKYLQTRKHRGKASSRKSRRRVKQRGLLTHKCRDSLWSATETGFPTATCDNKGWHQCSHKTGCQRCDSSPMLKSVSVIPDCKLTRVNQFSIPLWSAPVFMKREPALEAPSLDGGSGYGDSLTKIWTTWQRIVSQYVHKKNFF